MIDNKNPFCISLVASVLPHLHCLEGEWVSPQKVEKSVENNMIFTLSLQTLIFFML